jgi:glycine cleavage system H protein
LWVPAAGAQATIGITSFAADELGDIVFVELPEPGTQISQFGTFGVIESVKAVSDLYAPVSGEVAEVNEALRDRPELVNSDPYGEGWIARVTLSDTAELDGLMDAAAYGESTAG